jgi:outer membrane protein OmpA-like peptidoglycan-associated protein
MKTLYVSAIALAVAAALSTGCATKKYVQQTVSPVQQKVDTLDKKTADQAASISDLEKGVSRADERAQGAGTRADAAGREAARANEQAALASKEAANARTVGERGIARAGEVEAALGTKIENLDNFKPVGTMTVLFALGKSELDDEAKAVLDSVVSKAGSLKRYLVEVQGFTDSTGSPELNLELSQKRAAAVVRYLTSTGKLPLFRVNTVGYGEDNPAADNKTRDGRAQNRRVEVRIFSAN